MLYLAIIIAALAAGIIKTGFGVGAGVFLTPLLSLIMGPKEAVGLMTPMMLITDFITLYIFWKKWDWGQVKILFPGCVLGNVVGAYYLSWASPTAAKVTIGMIAVLFSFFQIYKEKNPNFFRNVTFKPWHGVLVSFFAGIASSIAHAGGIIITLYLLTVGLSKEVFVATLVCVLLISDISKAALFTNLHILTPNLILIGLAVTPVMLLGGWAGRKLMDRLNDRQYVLYINILILVSGIILLINH